MKKFSNLLLGLGALALFSACSNEEPNPTPAGGEDGSTLYLSINITNPNDARSRGTDGGLQFGDPDEHEINRADFLFYDANGNFVTRANIWKSTGGSDEPNIEYMGQNTLTLRNLTKENLPTYVITVLNAPVTFSEKVEAQAMSMEQTRMEQFNIVEKNGEDNLFVMSTTSFLNGDTERYDNDHYYATKLKTTDFLTEVPTADDVNSKAVDIYVERLAAKFELKGISNEGKFSVDVTIAGMENGAENDETISASTKVWVKIAGFGLTGQEEKSYLSKNLDGFTAEGTLVGAEGTGMPWEGWNETRYFRSYWGKSINYDSADGLGYATFAQCNANPTRPIYGYETTKNFNTIRGGEDNSLLASKVTNILITANVFEDEACQIPLNLVQYSGVYFTYPQFKKFVLSKLQAAGGLQYWTNEKEETTENRETLESGEVQVTTTTTYTYDPLNAEDFEWVDPKTPGLTGDIILVYKGGNLYKKGANYEEGGKLVSASVAEINAELANFDTQSPAIAFNGGSMFYSVPIEHLVASTDTKVTAEGQFGIVRNHWYQLTINKVLSLGHGVFDPEGLEGSETGEELIPVQDENEKYALATKINILAWKIVTQNVEL